MQFNSIWVGIQIKTKKDMKRQIKKWTYRLTATVLLLVGLLLIIILNPILTYANKTTHKNFTIYHNKPIDSLLFSSLDSAAMLLTTSDFYNNNLKLDICLNDGSLYPSIIKAIQGQAFAWGFYNKVVIYGKINCKKNFVQLNGYHWNLIQLLAHEMIHCVQYDRLGLIKSNPIANIPNWKWEGYAEYISRQNTNQKSLISNIDHQNQTDINSWELTFEDNTITPRAYYNYWILTQYCLDIKKMSYQTLLTDSTSEQSYKEEMMNWYNTKKSKTNTLDLRSIGD
jgi:hypothetical protein